MEGLDPPLLINLHSELIISCEGGRDGAVVRALASHQCSPDSIPGLGVMCGLSLLLVLVSTPRGFSPGTLVFPSPQKLQFDPECEGQVQKNDRNGPVPMMARA